MKSFFSLLKKLMVMSTMLCSFAFNMQAQTIDAAKYITVNQDIITVTLSEGATLTTAEGWSVNVGGTNHTFNANTAIRPNIAYLSGSGTNTINFRLLFISPKINIDPIDVAAGVKISYNGSGNTKNLSSNPMPARGPISAINDNIIDCSYLTSVQSIGV